ncbi:MAG: heme-binding domain-containing protein [Candidatus Krumholzibacteriia bacterium]
MTLKKSILPAVLAVIVVMQLIPLGRDNPPVIADFDGPPEVRAVLARSCFDCHSHETKWPWYSYVAPVSYLVVHDVKEGREHLNFSDWKGGPKVAGEILDEVATGEMPLGIYLPLHPEARLTGADLNVLQGYFGKGEGQQGD